MNDDVIRDLSWSSRAFKDMVWPEVDRLNWCGRGRLVTVEGSTTEGLAKEFDTLAGIDAWHLLDNRGFMRGIASRVQEILPGRDPYATFTVRYRRYGGAATEFEKRLSAIRDRDSGALYPHLTVQAYIRDRRGGPLLAAAMSKTVDVVNLLAQQLSDSTAERAKYVHERKRGCLKRGYEALGPGCVQGCAQFYPVKWEALASAGLRCRVSRPELQPTK